MSDISTANCMIWILVVCSLNVVWLLHVYIRKITHNRSSLTGVFSGEKISMFLVDQAPGLVEIYNSGISQTP